ncbi:Rbm17 [Symbiodinium sp. CCMP2592]|nr:Rbm17 [Symbiodinium sp. CCMP2592]
MERLGGKRSWEHWAPRPSRMEGPVKQLALDRAAKKKWADKIISVLAPYHRHFDNMQDIKPGEDKYEVWRPLVGKARVNSLKSVFYSLKKLRSTMGCSPLPFSEDMAKHLLHEDTSLDPPAEHFGGFDPTVNQAINRRYEYTRGLLVSSEAKKERRATPPSMEVVMALEKLAGTLPDGSKDGYAASFFRFCIGASVKKVGDNDRPQPLVAPLVSFSQVEWWGPLIALSKRRNSLATKGLEDDYLLPVPDRDRLDFTRAPCDNSRALRWLRALLSMKGAKIPEEEVKMMTLSSFRVFMPNLAFQMGVPREQRRYLGRWQGDSMADVYTREHRSVVLSIWKEVLSKPQPNKEDGIRFVPEDLDAPYYQLAEEPRLDPSEAQLPVLASAKDPQEENRADGPVFMATNSRKTGSPPVYRVHWFDRGYRCLGCGWRPKDSKSLVTFYELDWTPDYVFCAKAARAKQPPDCFLRDVVNKDSSSGEPSDGSGSASSLESDSSSSVDEEATPRMGASPGLLLHEVGIYGLLATPRSLGAVATGADPLGVAGISPADLAYFRPESVLALINSHVIGPSLQPSLCILLGPAAILGQTRDGMDRPGAEVDAKLTLARPPELCPDPYKEEVMKIEDHVRLVLGKQGFVTAQDWAGRWDEKELRKEAPKLGFSPGQNGYDEHTCVLTAIRLENAVEQFKLLKKRKLAEVDIHSVEDYKAMIGRGDRQEMRAAYLSKFGTEPEREHEGSDHMLGVLKRVLYRGEFLSGSQLDLNVANHPKDGELKFQKRQSKEDEEWIHEESNRVQSEKQWKRVLMIWRTSLLMVVATCTGPSCIHLTKADLDDFYNFLFGDTIMGREPAPSLGVLMTAERKVWRQVALNMAKDETLTITAALKEIQNNSRFWSMEIDEFCFRRHHTVQPKGPRKGKGKGKDKDKGKVWQQWDYWKGKGKKPGKSKGKSKKEDWRWATRSEEAADHPPPPPATFARTKASHQEWAPKGSDGKEFCKKYHAFNRCPGDCGRSHNCPVILPDGKVCEKNHRAADHS